jgi:two-component system sensor histidine kinase FlrB
MGAYGETRGFAEALDGLLAAARRGWNKARTSVAAQPLERAHGERLREAFHVFTAAAQRLEGSYAVLCARVHELSAQLARANAELTRQLQDKQALAERQTALLAALPAGVVVIGADGVVREANAAAEALLGAALVGRRWDDAAAALAPAGPQFEWLVGALEPRRIELQEQAVDASGERIVLLHDITEAHAARVVRERNERLASMGEMAARLAHQLRTPLSTAMLHASQLERVDLPAAERAALGGKILSRLRSLERVTRDMLRFVRGEAGLEQATAVSALVGEAAQAVEPLMAARGIGFACEDYTAGVMLLGDRRGLAAALVSLLENAVQATARGGRVRIAAMANSMRVRIQVSDSGSGIPEHALPHLFEPFYSTRADGTGLGLAIVKSVVEAHGGTIDVSSSPDAGTSFVLTLPCATQSRAGAAPPPRAPADPSAPRALEKEAA